MQFICDTKLFQDAIDIRNEVFIYEQGFQNEFDELDDISLHCVLYVNHQAIGVCRIYYDTTLHTYVLGRLAIIKSHRHLGYGSQLIIHAQQLIKEKGGTSIHLHSQCKALAFYQQLGFHAYGEIDYDEACPHQWMKKTIK